MAPVETKWKYNTNGNGYKLRPVCKIMNNDSNRIIVNVLCLGLMRAAWK